MKRAFFIWLAVLSAVCMNFTWAQNTDVILDIALAADANNNGFVDDDEILSLVSLWISGETVPDTQHTINDDAMLVLFEWWITSRALIAEPDPRPTQPLPPSIPKVEHPESIVGDNQKHKIRLYFKDPNGDVAELRIETLQGPNVGQPPRSQKVSFGTLTEGEFDVQIWCFNQGSQPLKVVEKFTFVDDHGLQGSREITYQCLPQPS